MPIFQRFRTSLGFSRLARLLNEPSPALTDSRQRRDARLLSTLLLAALLLITAGRTGRWLAAVPETMLMTVANAANVMVLALAYFLSRTPYYRLALNLAIISISLLQFVQTLDRAYLSPDYISNTAGWVVALVLVASLVESWRVVLLYSVANLAAICTLPFIVPGLKFSHIEFSAYFITAMTVFMLISASLRQRDLRRMEEGEKRYRTLLEASSEGLVLHDDGIIMDASDAFLRLLGYTTSEVVGRWVMEFVAPEDHETVIRNMGVPYPYEIRMLRKDGSHMDSEIHVKRIIYEGRLVRVIGIRDITGFKQAQAERERSTVLGQFISDASHDLRNPLAIMMTSLHLLRRRVGHIEGAAGNLDNLDQQVAHLARLVDDMLSMSQLDRVEADFQRAPVNLNLLCSQLVAERQAEAKAKEQTLHFEPGDALPPLLGDESSLIRAMTILADNALMYTPSGGTIRFRTRRADKHILIEIEDNGIGISPDALPHIFDRFYRGDAARRIETGGTGLGLAIARKIIRNHGGEITADSTPGAGSLFRVRLPAEG